MVARNNENLGGVLQSNAAQWRAYLSNLMQQRGIDPGRNIYAAQAINRAPEAQWLAQAMNVGDTGIQDFGEQWVNARFNGGGNYGGVDLSRQGMTNWLQGALSTTDRSSPQYKMFNSGDPDADYANLRSAMGIAQGGYSPMAQQAEQKALGDWYSRALGQMQQAGPDTPTNLLNYYYGRQDPGAPLPSGAAPLGSVPSGSANTPPGTAATTSPGLPPVNPNLTTFQSTPGHPWEAVNGTTQPATTPAATTPPPSRNVYATPQPTTTPPTGYGSGTPAPAATNAITSWTDLLNKYKSDQRNWGTEGFRPNPGAFNIGGVSYDPTKDTVSGFNNMSGSGRTTNRGNMMGQFLYYLNLLRTQRDGAGNRELGITRATTDDQLARIAAQRMGKNAVGSTGMTGY